MTPFFSVIVPVYNRPEELQELLVSLKQQTFTDFELVVVEDGSSRKSDSLVKDYATHFPIQYIFQDNAGPAIARNAGLAVAKGKYFLFIDSDCIAPEEWMEVLNNNLQHDNVAAFGGPDLAAYNFSLLQRAISFAMTSFFTTGGIRGGKRRVGTFHPRSFNMGISREVYESIGGFPVTRMHPGEDMVFSIEIIRRGFKTALFADAGVYHKRRNTLGSFFKQVFRFGKTRFIISRVYPETKQWVFWMPTLLTLLGALLLLAGITISWLFFLPMMAYGILIFFAAALPTNCSQLGLLSILTAAVQISAYGLGFLQAVWQVGIRGKDPYGVLTQGFYSP